MSGVKLALFAKCLLVGYFAAMRINLLLPVWFGMIFMFILSPGLRADEVDMQNGDRYFGRVLSVSADTVVLESQMLGKIIVPRKNVAALAFGTNAVAPKAVANVAQVFVPTNLPSDPSMADLSGTNVDFSAALRNLGADTNFTGQIRGQMLAGSPAATAKYDEMVKGLLTGSLSMDDLRREAQSDADQLRQLKHDLGPDAGDSIDAYLDVLDDFLQESESVTGPTNAPAVVQPKVQVH